MTRRLRQHLNPLKMTAMVPREQPIALPESCVVEAELGCGDAQFIIQLARLHPERHYVGLDIRDGFLDLGRDEIARLGLRNIQLELSNLMVDAERLFPPGRIRRFYINFPDPWFKARHRNRRWLDQTTLQHLVPALEPDGELFFQSDVWAVALEAMGLFEGCDRLVNTEGDWTFLRHNPYSVRSNREEAVAQEERPTWRLRFTRCGS